MAVSYTNDAMRKDHGDRFVCVLYFLVRGIRNRPFDSDKVYGKLPTGGFTDKQQARAELVQSLEDEQPPRIQYDRTNNMVGLTGDGLQWAEMICDKPPYLEYRYLQNNP